jgi:hypothetical protein
MEEIEKQKILESLKATKIPPRDRDVERIWGYVERNEITLPEMIAAQCLIREELTTIRERHAELEKQRQRDAEESKRQFQIETDLWNKCDCIRTKQAYSEYLKKYPNGHYESQANYRYRECVQREAEKKTELLKEMKASPEKFDDKRLKQLFADGTLEKSDLIIEGIITEKALDVYLNPPIDKFKEQESWKNLPDIPTDDRTDIYFYGIPGSGKSCVLAGMLYAAEREQILFPNISIKQGYEYQNELTDCITNGYVPKSTNTDYVNCLSFSFYKDHEHPLNVIEMSGEFFINTYTQVVDENEKLTAQKYLKNNNRKLLFFVIDYKPFSNIAAGLRTRQANMLTGVLSILEKDNILEQTDGIVIIVSKSDYMPQNQDKMKFTEEYLNNEYGNFIKILEHHQKRFKINKNIGNRCCIIPFSLGKFMLGRTFEYNPEDSKAVVDAILTLSRIRKKRLFKL